jgi:hypothetical protein
VISDELRRHVLYTQLDPSTTLFDWIATREAAAVDTAICLHDDLPGIGTPLSIGNSRDVGTIPLASLLPFLFRNKTPPAAPTAPTVTRSGSTAATLTWPSGGEVDLAGYDVFRTVPGGPPQKINQIGLVGRTTFVDAQSPAGATYTLVAVDTSGNRSAPSPPA